MSAQYPLFKSQAHVLPADPRRCASAAFCTQAAIRLGEIRGEDVAATHRCYEACKSLSDEALASLRADYERRLSMLQEAKR